MEKAEKVGEGGGGTEVVPIRHGLLIAIDSLFLLSKALRGVRARAGEG